MAFLVMILVASMIFFPLLSIFYFLRNKNGPPTNWPVVGMSLSLLWNLNRFQDHVSEMLEAGKGTFLVKGPWFSHMRLLITKEPNDINYIMNKNFANFVKGPEFKRIFDVLGEGIFNVDGDLWKFQRQMAHSFFGHNNFRHFQIKAFSKKIDEGLIPILDHAVDHGVVVDLQDLFARLTLDSICMFTRGSDPGSLNVKLEHEPFSKAVYDVEEALIFRHVVPESVSRLFKWLNIGSERKMTEGWKVGDPFIYKLIENKKQELKKRIDSPLGVDTKDEGVDLVTVYMSGKDESDQPSDKFLRDTVLSLIIAGRDTSSTALSWLFWLLLNNPEVKSKVLEELEGIFLSRERQYSSTKNEMDDLSKMVYLHAALCEALRLYPPVPLNHKSAIVPDKLPSGRAVDPNMKIVLSMYAMGRTKSIWGEDCMEFKPERWITEEGKLKNEPAHKFFSFGAGPRTCLGKEMAFVQMKTVASKLIGKYRFEMVERHRVVPDQKSIILVMKYGFKVRVFKAGD